MWVESGSVGSNYLVFVDMHYMKSAINGLFFVAVFGVCTFVGCARQNEISQPDSTIEQTNAANQFPAANFDSKINQSVSNENQSTKKNDAMAEAEREYDEMVKHPDLITNRPQSEWPFPNYQTGPGRPRPNYVNFYAVDDRFSSYLLCEYGVKEDHYDPSKELGWFKAALKQVRQSGSTKFPPVIWVAVAIQNVAEHKDASTFEQSFKVGAIFNASELFDSSHDLSKLVSKAEIDRHPFKYDLTQPTPGEQQRWMIVERHAATNNPITETK